MGKGQIIFSWLLPGLVFSLLAQHRRKETPFKRVNPVCVYKGSCRMRKGRMCFPNLEKRKVFFPLYPAVVLLTKLLTEVAYESADDWRVVFVLWASTRGRWPCLNSLFGCIKMKFLSFVLRMFFGLCSVQLLTLCLWWLVKIHAYRKMKVVTQQALLVQMIGKNTYHVHKLHVNKQLERDLYPSVRLLGVSGQPHSSSWKCLLRGVVEEGRAGLMNGYC